MSVKCRGGPAYDIHFDSPQLFAVTTCIRNGAL